MFAVCFLYLALCLVIEQLKISQMSLLQEKNINGGTRPSRPTLRVTMSM